MIQLSANSHVHKCNFLAQQFDCVNWVTIPCQMIFPLWVIETIERAFFCLPKVATQCSGREIRITHFLLHLHLTDNLARYYDSKAQAIPSIVCPVKQLIVRTYRTDRHHIDNKQKITLQYNTPYGPGDRNCLPLGIWVSFPLVALVDCHCIHSLQCLG